jgi:Predicted glycosyltransferase
MLWKITVIQTEIKKLHQNLYNVAESERDILSSKVIAMTRELDKKIFRYYCIVNSLQVALDKFATKWCPSQIKKITDQYMVIDASRIVMPKLLILSPGNCLFGEVIIDKIAYLFTCDLLDKKDTYSSEWIVSLPYDIKQFQRRKFIRSDSQILIQIKKIDKDFSYPTICLTNDIGGGGLSFLSEKAFDLAVKLNLDIDFPSTGIISVVGEIVRIVPKGVNFLISVKFIHIHESDRDKIIGFILKQLANKVKT